MKLSNGNLETISGFEHDRKVSVIERLFLEDAYWTVLGINLKSISGSASKTKTFDILANTLQSVKAEIWAKNRKKTTYNLEKIT